MELSPQSTALPSLARDSCWNFPPICASRCAPKMMKYFKSKDFLMYPDSLFSTAFSNFTKVMIFPRAVVSWPQFSKFNNLSGDQPGLAGGAMALCFIQNLTISAGTRFCKIVTSHFSWKEFCKEMLWSRHQLILLYAYYAFQFMFFWFCIH